MTSETRHDQMREEAQEFHMEHPEIWRLFVRFTFQLIERGFKHNSARAVFHRIRWETDQADVDGNTTFKINDHHSPFYARRFMKIYPDMEGFFRLRTQISKYADVSSLPALGPMDFPYDQT